MELAGIGALDRATQMVTRLAGQAEELTAEISNLGDTLGRVTGAGNSAQSGDESEAFREIADKIKSLSAGQQGAAPAGSPSGSNEASPADAQGGEGPDMLQVIGEILALIKENLQSGELNPHEAGKLLEQVSQLLQSSGVAPGHAA